MSRIKEDDIRNSVAEDADAINGLVDEYADEVWNYLRDNEALPKDGGDKPTKEFKDTLFDWIVDNVKDEEIDVEELKKFMLNKAIEDSKDDDAEAVDGDEADTDGEDDADGVFESEDGSFDCEKALKSVQKSLKSLLKKVDKAVKAIDKGSDEVVPLEDKDKDKNGDKDADGADRGSDEDGDGKYEKGDGGLKDGFGLKKGPKPFKTDFKTDATDDADGDKFPLAVDEADGKKGKDGKGRRDRVRHIVGKANDIISSDMKRLAKLKRELSEMMGDEDGDDD